MFMRLQQMRGLHPLSDWVLELQAVPGAKQLDQPRSTFSHVLFLLQACKPRPHPDVMYRYANAPMRVQSVELRRPPMAAQSIVDAAVCSEINIDLWLLPRDGTPLLLQAAAPLDARPENDSGRSRSTWGAWMQLPLIP